MNSKPKHILVIRLSAMGDVAMSIPVIRALINQNPDVKITVLSRGFLEPLFNTFDTVNFYSAKVIGQHKGILGLYKLFRELNQLDIDAIADIHNVLRSKILRLFFSFSRIKKVVIDKGRAEKKALTRTENKVFKQLKTTYERYADVFRKLGFDVDLSDLKSPSKPDLSLEVLKIIPSDHLKWIGIAPFAQYQSKVYPLDLMEQVISKLVETNNYKILLFGGADEENKLNVLAEKFENTVLITGKLDFKNELNLIANLDVMVSMDSANGHLAAMQGVKTITLWGGTHPFAGFAPFNQPKEYQMLPDLEEYPNIPCSVYGNIICKDYEDAMRSILPEKVVERIINNL